MKVAVSHGNLFQDVTVKSLSQHYIGKNKALLHHPFLVLRQTDKKRLTAVSRENVEVKHIARKMKSIQYRGVDYRKNKGLHRALYNSMRDVRRRNQDRFRVEEMSVGDIVAALRTGKHIVPLWYRNALTSVDTWYGTIDLRRLNNVQAYEKEDNPYIALMRDLWIAHSVGIIKIKMQNKDAFNNDTEVFAFCKKLFAKTSRDFRYITIPWHEKIMIDKWFSDTSRGKGHAWAKLHS